MTREWEGYCSAEVEEAIKEIDRIYCEHELSLRIARPEELSAQAAIREHNKGCLEACGKTSSHQYVKDNRRCDERRDCPECPKDWMIEYASSSAPSPRTKEQARREWHRQIGCKTWESCPTEKECRAFDAGFDAALPLPPSPQASASKEEPCK